MRFRPLGTGDKGPKAIDALAGKQAANLQRRQEYRRDWYVMWPTEEKEELLKRQAE